MPLIGYGAFQMDSSGIRAALDAGYRLIDTAESYRNETEVGTVLHEFLGDNPELGREDIWIVSKNSSSRGRTAARTNLERQLVDLQVDYIDLYYLHSWEADPALRAETWAVMEEYYAAGKIKALGISNHCASSTSTRRTH
jgi:2,5-diketo-D-gluconate reductase A